MSPGIEKELIAREIEDKEKLKKLREFFADSKDLLTVYIFGSYGTSYENKNSDIDFGILFKEAPSLMNKLFYAGKIESIMGRETDLVTLNTVNVLLQHRIIKTGTKIYERDFIATADFKESVLNKYFDFGVVLKKLKRDFHQGLGEEYNYDR
ncbi:MAG: type VII toxin-antitoxin system MntA family adenylyltransferase antitoxin [Halanaerobiaceae bacterium]